MKLARYTAQGRTTIGIVRGDRILALDQVLASAPATIRAVLAAGAPLRAQITATLPSAGTGLALAEVHLEAPIPDAQKYLAIGMNY